MDLSCRNSLIHSVVGTNNIILFLLRKDFEYGRFFIEPHKRTHYLFPPDCTADVSSVPEVRQEVPSAGHDS